MIVHVQGPDDAGAMIVWAQVEAPDPELTTGDLCREVRPGGTFLGRPYDWWADQVGEIQVEPIGD